MTRLEIVGQMGLSKKIRGVTMGHTSAIMTYVVRTVSAFSDGLYIE